MIRAKTLRPGLIPFWFFNDASTIEEKVRYLRSCHAGGITALAMHCRSGNLIPYASAEWYETVRSLVKEARKLKMQMWLYDEDPYPSGAAGGQVMAERPDMMASQLVMKEPPKTLSQGQLWEISERPVVWVGLVPGNAGVRAVDLSKNVGTIRRDWFVTPWDSRWYYPATPIVPCVRGDAIRQFYCMRMLAIPKGYKLAAIVRELCGVDGSWGSLPDCLHQETFPLFCKLSLEPYKAAVGKEFGQTIPGIFTDEEKPHGFWPVTKDTFSGFQKTYGYDLKPRLYQLFGDPLSTEYTETRLALRAWITQRFIDVFMRPYREWADEQGLNLVGHVSPEDDPVAEACTLGNVMPLMKIMHCPGTDLIAPLLGTKESPTTNLGSLRAGSVRSQTGAPAAICETFGLFDWDTTTSKLHQVAAWHKVLGIDRFFPHGFFTTVDGSSAHEAPPDYGPKTAIFDGVGELNKWSSAMESILDGASDMGDTAILNSIVSFWDTGPGMNSAEHAKMREGMWLTILNCLRSHSGAQLVDDSDMAAAAIGKGSFKVGLRSYKTLLIPALTRIPKMALARISLAARQGVRVIWFGGGPREVVGVDMKVGRAGRLPGSVVRAPYPTDGWCRKNLSALVQVRGAKNEQCYLREVRKSGDKWLLAVNVGDEPMDLSIKGEAGRSWTPHIVDGVAEVIKAETRWHMPGRGSGLFKLTRAGGSAVAYAGAAVETGSRRSFRRLDTNCLRLDSCDAVIGDDRPRKLAFPRPYWQLSENYKTERIINQYAGGVPIDSTVANAKLNYVFTFNAAVALRNVVLVCEPRSARGVFETYLNGRQVGGKHLFPLRTTKALRLRLPSLRKGPNTLEIRFSASTAMDGLMAHLFLEGDFDVDSSAKGDTLTKSASRDARAGWQAAGLPHYMGRGVYSWTHRFSEDASRLPWMLELESVIDSAELRLNGKSLGRMAWAPWTWQLKGVRNGDNQFELCVSGNGGNKRKLLCPSQGQGWMGRAWLKSVKGVK